MCAVLEVRAQKVGQSRLARTASALRWPGQRSAKGDAGRASLKWRLAQCERSQREAIGGASIKGTGGAIEQTNRANERAHTHTASEEAVKRARGSVHCSSGGAIRSRDSRLANRVYLWQSSSASRAARERGKQASCGAQVEPAAEREARTEADLGLQGGRQRGAESRALGRQQAAATHTQTHTERARPEQTHAHARASVSRRWLLAAGCRYQ